MANVKISNLTAATTPVAGTEVLPIVQSSATVKVSIANLTAGRSVSATGLALTGSTSGTVTLTAKAVAGSTTFKLPAADGTSNQAMVTDGSGNLSFATIAATPGGSTTQVQYNNAGAFAGSANLVFDGSNLGVGVTPTYRLDVARSGNGVSARFSQGSFFSYIYSGGSASYFSADTGALTSYGLAASTLSMSAGNGADQLVVSQTSVKPNVLLDISGASAGRIQFPATQVASADANTLDDYEEGTWTPVLGGAGGTSGQTYTGIAGRYTKIGRQVTCWFYVELTAKGTITGDAVISGLPFTVNTGAGDVSGMPGRFANFATNWTLIFAGPVNGQTYAYIGGTKGVAGTWTQAATADIANNTRLEGCFTYNA